MSATPVNQIPVNREEIRMLVAELGYEKTSEKTGIKSGTLRQWSARFGWKSPIVHAQQTVTTVTRPSDVLASELAENEKETRLSLSRYARRASRDAEEASLREAPYVKQVADVAGKVHKWDQQGPGTVFSLNVLNLSMLDDSDD